jgi:hypothetical protein
LLEQTQKIAETMEAPPALNMNDLFTPRSRAGSMTTGRKTHVSGGTQISGGPKSVIMINRDPSNSQIEVEHAVERLIIRKFLVRFARGG